MSLDKIGKAWHEEMDALEMAITRVVTESSNRIKKTRKEIIKLLSGTKPEISNEEFHGFILEFDKFPIDIDDVFEIANLPSGAAAKWKEGDGLPAPELRKATLLLIAEAMTLLLTQRDLLRHAYDTLVDMGFGGA